MLLSLAAGPRAINLCKVKLDGAVPATYRRLWFYVVGWRGNP
jgi:hypothetical protein